MGFTVYYRPEAASMAPRVALEELGQAYELELVTRAGDVITAPDGFFSISPAGTVPALRDGAIGLSETAAVLIYLADRFPESPLGAPLGSAERGHWYRWLIFLSNTVMPPFYAIYYPERWGGESAAAYGSKLLNDLFDTLEAQLATTDHLVGDRFTMVDILLGMLISWGDDCLDPPITSSRPNLARVLARFLARPSVAKVLAEEAA